MHRVLLYLSLIAALSAQDKPAQVVLPADNDSRKLAHSIVPESLGGLGNLRSDLIAHFAMDARSAGGLAWSRTPMGVKSVGDVELRDDEGRTYLRFAKKGSKLRFEPELRLPSSFTLTAWVQVPVGRSGIIWHGGESILLSISKNGLGYWDGRKKAGGSFAEATSPLEGWHHVAITSGNARTQAFLDGKPLAVINSSIDDTLSAVGNRPAKYDAALMAAGIDEQFYFSRVLTASEIAAVMNFGKPGTPKR